MVKQQIRSASEPKWVEQIADKWPRFRAWEVAKGSLESSSISSPATIQKYGHERSNCDGKPVRSEKLDDFCYDTNQEFHALLEIADFNWF